MPTRWKMIASSFINAMFRSRCVFSMTLAASATLIDDALWTPAVTTELDKIRVAGEAVRGLGMRFNAGHALNYYNVQPIARLPAVRELHIGHAIVSRAVFTGLRESVREMKRLMREAAASGA